MTEQAPESGTEQPQAGEQELDPTTTFDAERAMKEVREANREAQNLRKRLKEYEDSQKTETQRLIEERDALKAERDDYLSQTLRARVALTKGLSAELADRLRGASEDELSEDADRLLALIKPAGPARFGDVDQGVRSTPPASNADGKQVAKALFGSRT